MRATPGRSNTQKPSPEVTPLSYTETMLGWELSAPTAWHSRSNRWRAAASSCVAMSGDTVPAGERCASTSNRNFEGRQGKGARTHLMSPAMVAAAAVTGHLIDVRKLMRGA